MTNEEQIDMMEVLVAQSLQSGRTLATSANKKTEISASSLQCKLRELYFIVNDIWMRSELLERRHLR